MTDLEAGLSGAFFRPLLSLHFSCFLFWRSSFSDTAGLPEIGSGCGFLVAALRKVSLQNFAALQKKS